jgi:hypothetical protein
MESRAGSGQSFNAVESLVLDLAVEEAVNIDWLNEEIETFRSLANNNANGIGAAEVISNLETVKDFLYETVTEDFFEYYQSRYRVASRELNSQVRFLGRVFDDELELIGERIDYSVFPEGYRNYVLQDLGFEEAVLEETDTYMQFQYDQIVLGEAMGFEMAYPSVYTLFFINNKAKLLSRYSPYAISMTLDSIRKWQEKDLNLRVITEYCDFFERVLQVNRPVQRICEAERTKESQLGVSYLAFSFAELLGSEQRNLIEDRDGPIDFNLEERFEVIKDLRLDVRTSTLFADLSLDFETLIEREQEFRIFDDNISFLPERGNESFTNWHEAAVAVFNESFRARADLLSVQSNFLLQDLD